VSERLFLALPDEEKKLWHSHFYEVEEVLIFLGFSTLMVHLCFPFYSSFGMIQDL
jgi:hypothetical protein